MIVAAVMTLAIASACHRAANDAGTGADDSTAASPVPTAAATDTVRGVLTAVGSEPLTALVITTTNDRVVLAGTTADDVQMLRNVVGLELMVRGTRTGSRSAAAAPQPVPVFRVSTFVVRSAEGYAAVDGVVSNADNAFSLLLADGRRVSTPRLPASLRQKIGMRVFVAGPLDAPPISYGIISANQPPI